MLVSPEEAFQLQSLSLTGDLRNNTHGGSTYPRQCCVSPFACLHAWGHRRQLNRIQRFRTSALQGEFSFRRRRRSENTTNSLLIHRKELRPLFVFPSPPVQRGGIRGSCYRYRTPFLFHLFLSQRSYFLHTNPSRIPNPEFDPNDVAPNAVNRILPQRSRLFLFRFYCPRKHLVRAA